MDVRWMPLFAAAVGVLGGVGGALVGGFIASQNQEEGFRRERAAAKQDLRVEAYADFLGTAQGLVVVAQTDDKAKEQELLVKLFVSRARVLLVFENPEVGKAATNVRDAATSEPTEEEIANCGGDRDSQCVWDKKLKDYVAAGEVFLALAREEIAATAE